MTGLGQRKSCAEAPLGDIVPAAKLPILRRRKSQENKCRINWDFRETRCRSFFDPLQAETSPNFAYGLRMPSYLAGCHFRLTNGLPM